ncbi:hypothetical protein ACEPAI_1425 [Sanghuangporus weigelae]
MVALCHFVVVTICGSEGKLRFIDDDQDITQQDMERGVNLSDHLVFCLFGEIKFMDGLLRFRSHDRTTVSTRSRIVPSSLRRIYQGCPFTKVRPDACHVCHLIPYAKGDEYLRKILTTRNVPDENMTIDSAQNMLMMDALLFDNIKHVAFLKTPNNLDEADRMDFSRKAHSSLKGGSGSRHHSPEVQREDVICLPKDVLLDFAYVYALLMKWGPKNTKKMLEEDRKSFYYPNGMVMQGEDRQEELRGKEKTLGTQHSASEWHRRSDERAKIKDENKRLGNDVTQSVDLWGFLYEMTYLSRGFLPEEIEAEQERRRNEQREAESISKWIETINGQQETACAAASGDSKYPYSCLNGSDNDEKPISVQKALGRLPPKYPIPQKPFLTFSGDNNSDNSVDLLHPR